MGTMFRMIAAVGFLMAGMACPAHAGPGAHKLSDFLSGHLVGDGQFRTLVDSTSRNVHVEIQGIMRGQHLQLVEDTHFSDGEIHHKVWQVAKVSEGRYIGQRADLVGAARIDERGDEIEMVYKARVPTKNGGVHTLDFDEHFVLSANGVLTNRMRISFLFVTVGEADLSIRRLRN